MRSTAPPICAPKALCFWRTHVGSCGRHMAWLPIGPFVTAERMSWDKCNHVPISRMFCLPQRKMRRTGIGKEVAPCGNASISLSAPVGLSLSALSVMPLCLYPSLSLSLSVPLSMPLCLHLPFSVFSVYLSLSVCLSLYFSVSLFQPLYFSLFSSLLLSVSSSLSPMPLSSLSFLLIFFFPSFLSPLLFFLSYLE